MVTGASRGAAYDRRAVPPDTDPITFVPSSDGVVVALHDLGGPADPAAPVLLLSHATGFCALAWRPLASHLVDRFRCYALDYRGHGRTELPAGATLHWSGMADDALAVLEHLGAGTDHVVHGVAHSMGGAALVLAEARRPGSCATFWLYEPVLVPPGAPAPTGEGNVMATTAARRRATFASAEEAYTNYASKPPLAELAPEALAAYVEGGFAPGPDGAVTLRCRPETEAAVFNGAATSGAWDRLGDLTLPVAVVAGRPEPFGPVAFARPAVEAMRHATLVERPDLGHFGPLQRPAEAATDLAQWIDSNRGG